MGGRGSWSQTRTRGGIRGTGGRRGKLHPIDLSEYQGRSLQEIEEDIRVRGKERLVAIDGDGNVIRAYQGTQKSVAFDYDLLLVKGATVTHNHPVGGEGYGGTFSLTDVKNMAASEWAEHRATASGPNEMNYIIRRNSSTTKKNSQELYARIVKDEPALRKAIKDAANKAGKSLSSARRRQIYVGVLDEYYARVLPEYNFEYIARNKPYRYNR